VADVEHFNDAFFDSEEDSVGPTLLSMKKLTDDFLKSVVLGG